MKKSHGVWGRIGRLAALAWLCSIRPGVAADGPATATTQAPASDQVDEGTGGVIVVSEGVGSDVEAAKLDAYRNAVRQAVGTYVDATTIVANDKLITDEIIALSGAFVSKVEVIPDSVANVGTLTRIRVKATVETQKILTALHKNKVRTTSEVVAVDTDSLLAELDTQENRLGSAERLLKKLFDGYPQKCFRASLVGQPAVRQVPPGKLNPDDIELLCRIRIEADFAAWQEFSKALTDILSKVALSREMIRIKSHGPPFDAWFEPEQFKQLLDQPTFSIHENARGSDAVLLNAKRADPLPPWPTPPKEHQNISVLVAGVENKNEFAWEVFAVPNRIMKCVPNHWVVFRDFRLETTAGSLWKHNIYTGIVPTDHPGAGRVGFSLVDERSGGTQKILLKGFFRAVGVSCPGDGSRLIAPGFFMLRDRLGGLLGHAEGVECTVSVVLARSDLSDGLKLRCVLE